ncbi:MAG: cytochrome c3 family protein [Myxococcota bacterium]
MRANRPIHRLLARSRVSDAGRALVAGLAVVLALAAWGAPDAAAKKRSVDNCMECHEDVEGETLDLLDGSEIPIEVDRQAWDDSVHAGWLQCVDCHTTINGMDHPEVRDLDARSYRLRQAETCNRCHYAHYTRTLDGIHYEQLAKGDDRAPTCVDCHGAHGIVDPNESRRDIPKRCANCHPTTADEYARSVHGKALADGAGRDVPVCTDCHGAHEIEDPREDDFKLGQHEICARCHQKEGLMERYGLSADVVGSYLDDFHGSSNAMYVSGEEGTAGKPMVTCSDCHGVHDIPSYRDMEDEEAVQARVLETCKSCHEDVPAGFEDAWLGHYAPTLASAPLVWGVTWFYRIIIPLMLIAFVLHILLHLWRVRVRR